MWPVKVIVDRALMRRRHHRGEFAGTAAVERPIKKTEHVVRACPVELPRIRRRGQWLMQDVGTPGCGGCRGPVTQRRWSPAKCDWIRAIGEAGDRIIALNCLA